ncbi:PLP-dependent aminotransferase NCgl2355 class III [Vibrio maritimus]|uniref:PLP-dependent aminotransferase NCgl2355 class III n=1 Tax=Vibrio maritimus TaxID=990268 RepID=A0A090RRN4_9VIBR|nr:PLP-dependent aminotransferase NCgl2355 class III [Vibrio maritimus]
MDLLSSEITNQDVIELDKHVFHSWSVQESATPIAIANGQGCTMWDFDGKEYLDFSSQLVNTNIGHQHPKVIEALKNQADTLVTIAPATANITRGMAAKRILERAPLASKRYSLLTRELMPMRTPFVWRGNLLGAIKSSQPIARIMATLVQQLQRLATLDACRMSTVAATCTSLILISTVPSSTRHPNKKNANAHLLT